MPAFIQNESGDFADTAVGHDAQAILEVAERLFTAEPDWIVFFREIMGLDGIVRRTYQTPDSLMRFECSAEYARIREMLDALRQRQQEKTPVIVIAANGLKESLSVATMKQEGKMLGNVPALLDSGSGADVMKTGTAKLLGLGLMKLALPMRKNLLL